MDEAFDVLLDDEPDGSKRGEVPCPRHRPVPCTPDAYGVESQADQYEPEQRCDHEGEVLQITVTRVIEQVLPRVGA